MPLTNSDLLAIYREATSTAHKLTIDELKDFVADDFVKIAGDNMTGDLTLGTDKITLNAAGSATFAGTVGIGLGTSSSDANLDFGATSKDSYVINLRKSGNSRTSIGVNAEYGVRIAGPFDATATASFGVTDSSQDFIESVRITNSGNALIGGTLPSAPNISLNADGSGTFSNGSAKAEIIIGTRDTPRFNLTGNRTSSSVVQFIDENGDTPFVLNGDGSAEFAGSVKSSYLNVAASPAQTSGNLVKIDGASTNVITFGYDGSATFTSRIAVGSVDNGTTFTSGYGITAYNSSDDSTIWARNSKSGKPVYTGVNAAGVYTSQILEDGSASFAGDIGIGGTLPSAPNITLESSSGRIKVNDGLYVSSLNGGQAVSIYNNSGTASTKNALAIANNGGGSPKSIELKYDGSGTFAGAVKVGNISPTANSNEGGTTLYGGSGGIRIYRSTTAKSAAIDCENNGTQVWSLYADGSASFAGAIGIGGTLPSAPNIELNANGSAKFAENIIIDEPSGADSFRVTLGGNQVYRVSSAGTVQIGNGNKIQLNVDGSAEFAGGVKCLSLTSESDVTNTWFRTNNTLNSVTYAWATKNQDIDTWNAGMAKDGKLVLGNIGVPSGAKITLDGVDGNATFAGILDIGAAYKQTAVALSGASINLNLSNYFTTTINGATSFTFTNAVAGKSVSFTLEVTYTSGTITWPASVKWPSDKAPTLTAGKKYLFMFVTDDGGSTYYASALADYS